MEGQDQNQNDQGDTALAAPPELPGRPQVPADVVTELAGHFVSRAEFNALLARIPNLAPGALAAELPELDLPEDLPEHEKLHLRRLAAQGRRTSY